jgi:hypothetical protein
MFLPGTSTRPTSHVRRGGRAPDPWPPFPSGLELVLDVATRKAVGWSIGLAESTWRSGRLRNACETNCVPAIYYVDKGSGRTTT